MSSSYSSLQLAHTHMFDACSTKTFCFAYSIIRVWGHWKNLNNGFLLNHSSWKFCFMIKRNGTAVSVKTQCSEFRKVARYGGYHCLDSLSFFNRSGIIRLEFQHGYTRKINKWLSIFVGFGGISICCACMNMPKPRTHHLPEHLLELGVRMIGARCNVMSSKAEANTLVKLFENFMKAYCIQLHEIQ